MNMSVQTGLVRNFLSAAKPWSPPGPVETSIDMGLLVTTYLGSVFAFNDSFQELARGLKNRSKYSTALNIVDKMFFSTSSPGPEFLILRHSINHSICAAKKDIYSGTLKLVYGFAFIVLTVATSFGCRIREIHLALAAIMAAAPGLIWLLWKDAQKAQKEPQKWQHLAMHLNGVHKEHDSVVTILKRAFDSGFGEQTSMHDILRIFAPDHVSALATAASNQSALEAAAQQEFGFIHDLLESIAAQTRIKSGGPSPLISDAQNNAFNLSRAAEQAAPISLLRVALNFVAWYGYVVLIAVFFYPASHFEGTLTGASHCCTCACVMKYLKFGLCDGKATLWFRFAADVAWTIDCALVMNLFDNVFGADEQPEKHPDAERIPIANDDVSSDSASSAVAATVPAKGRRRSTARND